jgi:hypothetical protein
MSRWHSGSENFRPMRRFVAKRVFSGLTTACRFAEMPTNRSPFSANATTDGVVLAPNAMESAHVGQPFTARCDLPSEFSIIFGVFPSITATAELVVPRCCQSTQTPGGTRQKQCHHERTQVNANDLALDLLFSTC